MNYPYQIRSQEQYQQAYQKSITDPEAFWSDIAGYFTWRRKWDKVLEWNFTEPSIKWFQGGHFQYYRKLPGSFRANDQPDAPAIIWEPNDPAEKSRVLTYEKLHKKVCQFAWVLKRNGVRKGDRVCIYMGMVPELAIAVLACARIGAIHSVVFGGFSAQSIADRVLDAGAEFIITCDGANRGAKDIPLKSVIDDALIGNHTIKKVIVCLREQGSP